MNRLPMIVVLAGLVGCTAQTGDADRAPEADGAAAAAPASVPASTDAEAAPAPVSIPGVPDDALRLGDAITVTEAPVALAAVRAHPDDYFERTILVTATTEAVCQTAGCWMTIADGEGEPIWVRWATGCGGKYSFPKDAAGKRIVVQGSFYPKEIAEADAEHIAQESGGALAAEDIAGRTFEMNATACVVLPDAETSAGPADQG
jgi:hypothetical protein